MTSSFFKLNDNSVVHIMVPISVVPTMVSASLVHIKATVSVVHKMVIV